MQLSRHAELRIQQRGITAEVIKLHEQFADQDAFVGSGCVCRTVTQCAFDEMVYQGISVQLAEKVKRLAVVYGRSGDIIVTALPMKSGLAKHYMNGCRKRPYYACR